MANLSHEDPAEYVQDLDERFTDVTDPAPADRPRVWMPAVDVKSSSKRYIVEAELPGMTQSDVDVRVEEDRLVLSAEREEETEKKGEEFIRRERYARSFTRTFRLPADVNRAKIEAEFSDGVLTVTVPRGKDTSRSEEKSIRVTSG
ncbi:MAG: Hsp20/alpha crystallin family protein [Spirochaetota bacterium]